jgi:thioredoxin-related protein
MKTLLALSLALITLTVHAGDFPAGSPKFEHSLKTATANAAKSGKPIIAVFSAVWCGPCQMMKKEVYPSAAVKAYHDKFEWVYLDVDDKSNNTAAKKYEVNGIPHIQFIGSDGKDLGSQVGSTSPEDFANTLEQTLKKAAGSAKAEKK